MILVYKKNKKDSRLQKIDEISPDVWIRVDNPSLKELDKLSLKLHLDDSILNDGIDPYEGPRLEVDEGNFYIFVRAPYREEGDQIITVPLLIALGKDAIVTISAKSLVCFSQIISNDKNFYTDDKIGVLIRVMQEVNASYATFLSSINKNVRSASSDIEEITNKEISQFVSFENLMNDFLSALVPMSAMLGNLKSGKVIKITEDEKEIIEDLKLNTEQLIELSKSSLKNITNIRDSYSTIVSNRLNRTMKLLTTITIIMTIPTIISSFFGMNVHVPLAQNPFGFYIIGTVTIIILGILMYILNKNKWF